MFDGVLSVCAAAEKANVPSVPALLETAMGAPPVPLRAEYRGANAWRDQSMQELKAGQSSAGLPRGSVLAACGVGRSWLFVCFLVIGVG